VKPICCTLFCGRPPPLKQPDQYSLYYPIPPFQTPLYSTKSIHPLIHYIPSISYEPKLSIHINGASIEWSHRYQISTLTMKVCTALPLIFKHGTIKLMHPPIIVSPRVPRSYPRCSRPIRPIIPATPGRCSSWQSKSYPTIIVTGALTRDFLYFPPPSHITLHITSTVPSEIK
jgi:hypothetical protein